MEAIYSASESAINEVCRHIVDFIYNVIYFIAGFAIRDASYKEFAVGENIKEKSKVNDNSVNMTAARLLDEYGNSILRMAYSYLHNMADAEDILQDTLIKYIQNAPTFEGSGHEKAWLLRVAANLSKNRIDYNRIRQTDELEDTLVGEDRQDLAFVWEAVKKLPPTQSEIVHLYYYEGYSTKEIAEILNCKEATVRSNMKRGRDSLKVILKEGYDFE